MRSYSCKSKTSQETQKSLQKFLEPITKPKVIYTDNSLDFGKACEELAWNHCTSTPHISETNGIAERTVRRMKGHLQCCCNKVWMKNGWRIAWKFAAICETFKISCLMGRHHMKGGSEYHFNGPETPFAAMVEYHPIFTKDQSQLHQFGTKVLPGIFFGYVLSAVGIWKGDIMVADIEELEQIDASELHARRLNAKEVFTPMKGEKTFSQSKMEQSKFLEEIRI